MKVLADADLDQLRALTARGEPVWLDLRDPEDAELEAIGEILGLHEVAVRDSMEFGQRPKLNRYPHGLLLVFFGLFIDSDGASRPVEVHVHVAREAVVTISRAPPAQLERVRESLEPSPECSPGELVYRVLDAIADSLTDGLDVIATQIDEFEQTIFTRPRASDRDRMAVLRRQMDRLARTLAIQHRVFDRAAGEIAAAAEEDEGILPYLTDVGDHLWRALDEAEADRDTLTGMLETYSNEVQERLTVVATIFLPLTALTGFFGMNFNWMINHIGAAWTFFGLGVGGLAASCLVINLWLRRTGLTDRSRPRT